MIFQNYGRKFYQQVGRESMKTNEQLNAKETKHFRSKIWEQKEHNKNAEWINDTIKKKNKNLEKTLRVISNQVSLSARLKKVPNWKTPGYVGIHRFWFKKSTRNCLSNRVNTQMDDKKETTLIQKDLKREKTADYFRKNRRDSSRSHRDNDLIYIGHHNLRELKKRRKDVAMA